MSQALFQFMDAAEQALDELELKWGEDYPIVIKSWRDNWERLSTAHNIHHQHRGGLPPPVA